MAKYYLVCILYIILITSELIKAADPDPLQDYKSSTDSSNFVLRDVFKNGDVTKGPGGVRAALNTDIFPAMDSQGLTYVHFAMKPCGINLPHTHPRATEMLTMVQGGPIQAGFVDIYPGDVTVFPRGMLHFEMNVGTKPALFISALNSQNHDIYCRWEEEHCLIFLHEHWQPL